MSQQPSAADEWLRIHQLNSSDCKDEVNYAPFKAVLTTNSSFFKPTFTSDSLDLPSYVSACISEFLGPDASPSKQSDVVQIGSALLGSFMQTAWTGPALDYDLMDLLPESIKSHGQPALNKSAIKLLSEDGEDVYHLAPCLVHLVLAKLILVNNSDALSTVPTAPWWKFRTLFVQQRVLDNQSNTLNESILETAVHVEKSLESEYFTQQQDLRIVAELRARFYLELGFVHHYYERNAKALAEFTRAQKATQLVWKLTGALGKRTKFQTFDVTQLVVIAESKDLNASAGQQPAVAETTAAMPETLALNDDTLLETIDYTDLESKGGNLRIIDQCILLAMCLNIKNENPTDGLTTEQMKPFVSRVLENPNNWMVHTMGLLLRSRLEAAKSRTTERSVLQLQAIVDQMAVEQDSTPSERLNHIYSIFIPSKWELESELADRLVSIGVVKSALEIFERLELWDNVVSCHQMLEQNSKAEQIVRKQLESTPDSPKLHCLLGDITRDSKHYYEAWSISNQRYARAMRSLGSYYFRTGDFVESVKCYDLALAINPLFENSWFVMGCAALRAEDWNTAQRAFLKTVLLNSDNGEAWTNLANVYVKQNKKREAWRALREALRQHHDNPKIWDNYLFISLDLGEFGESVRAMTRVFEIRSSPVRAAELSKNPESLVDLGCLQILVHAVVHDIQGADGLTAGAHVKQINTLLEGVVNKMSGSARLFTLCSQFYTSQEQYKLALEYLGKAYRVYLHAPELNNDERLFKLGADVTERLAEGYREFGPLESAPRLDSEAVDGAADEAERPVLVPVCADWRYQARTALRTFISRTKDTYEGTPEHDHLKEILASFSAASE
ncbi:hypothetical protein HDU79_003154 [Rhizoclosmatium sp. JEL0117]|nr:hypothetical protein HDU79_003154 [Rhizoclosmatium sp. JEL0117]